MTEANFRKADHPIHSLFLERWSPRAYTGEAMPEAELMTLLEAARWAPSSYNSQPWRFIYAIKGTPHWEKLLGLRHRLAGIGARRPAFQKQ
jgi:nitroreductase